MNYILYTTSKSDWIKQQFDIFVNRISQTKGRDKVEAIVVYKKPSKTVKIYEDEEGDLKPDWKWLQNYYPRGEHDAVFIHFTPYYRKLWGVTEAIGGARNKDNKEFPECWVCADIGVPAKGYPKEISDFLRKLYHEQAHFDEDLDDEFGNILTQNSVHDMDYKLKQIHNYHLLVDYRGRAFKDQINKLFNKVMKLAKQYV